MREYDARQLRCMPCQRIHAQRPRIPGLWLQRIRLLRALLVRVIIAVMIIVPRQATVITNPAFSPLSAMAADIELSSRQDQPSAYDPRIDRFDTDSYIIGIDRLCSRTITPYATNFVDTPIPVNLPMSGVGPGKAHAILSGTVRWAIYDNWGIHRQLLVPNTLCVPSAPLRLLSPQHYAQELAHHEQTRDGTFFITFADQFYMAWNDQSHSMTAPLNHANVPVVRSAASFSTVLRQPPDDDPLFCMPATLPGTAVRENDDTHATDAEIAKIAKSLLLGDQPATPAPLILTADTLTAHDYMFAEPTSPQQELLKYHYRLGHTSFARLQQMAKMPSSQIPSRLAEIEPPQCAACVYGKCTKKPWRNKSDPPTLIQATYPGQCVSVDQFESTTPGLIGTMRGIPTKQRYYNGTIFVDHYSDLTYVYLQQSNSGEETLEAKKAFEAYAP
jgi:hypothetical protein